MGNLFWCCSNYGDDLPPTVVYNAEYLKMKGRMPRCPEDNAWQVKVDDIDRERSLLIFVSHNWLQTYPGARGYDGRPHPDTRNHDKLNLLLDAISKIKQDFVTDKITNFYVWLDYGCIDQDFAYRFDPRTFARSIDVCDIILTPIYDEATSFPWLHVLDHPDANKINLDDLYGSPGWNQGDYSYLNRAWCRLEMFYAANIPPPRSDPSRIRQFKAALLASVQAGRRPHLLYGSCEQKTGNPIRILPPIQNTWFKRFNPVNGKLTKETDRKVVHTLVDELLPLMKFVKPGYEGETRNGKRHGRGTYRFDSGSVYVGEFKDNMFNGKGICRFADGNVYEGEFLHNKFNGKGICRFADGDTYDGDFKEDKKNGRGVYQYSNGDVYDGEFKEDKKNGKGILFTKGNVYEGEFKDDKKNGKGTYRFATGDVYKGNWKDDTFHGAGVHRFASGAVYEGGYKDGQKDGKGIYRYANGNVYEGELKSDKYNGKGIYRYANGEYYDGEWKDDKFNGKGTMRYRDGRVVRGKWKDGQQVL